jgi:hypothetical protein
MTTSFANLVRCLVLTGVVLSTSVAQAAFTSYVIRQNGMTSPDILPRNDIAPGAEEFGIALSGQKAGLGSNDINGATIGEILDLSITRYDDTTRFAAGSGPAVAPYLNIWVTDGMGNYAVVANEPSNPAFQPLFETVGLTKEYNLSFDDLSSHPVQVYETANGGYGSTTTWVHNLVGNQPLTFADIADLVIAAPSPAYIAGPNSVGSGAPRELGSNVAFGVNWVFGDTLANYLSGDDGFIVGQASAQAVPEPSTVAIVGLAGLVGLAVMRRRQG